MWFLLLILAVLAFARADANMLQGGSGGGGTGPIAFTNSIPMSSALPGTTLTASFTSTAGTNCGLLITFETGASDPTSVTWNSLTATKIFTHTGSFGFPQSMWFMPIGNIGVVTSNIVATLSSQNILGAAAEYCHIQQTTTADGTGFTDGAPSGSANVSLTTTTAGDWAFITLISGGGAAATNGSNMFLRQQNNNGAPANPAIFDSNAIVPVNPGANTLNITAGAGSSDILVIGLRPG